MKHKQCCVVITGAGISADSGVPTFRGAGGLWQGHRVEEVATPEAFARNPQLVLDFYNQRRRDLKEVVPNPGHYALAQLETGYDVRIITQNVDDLHERAGSSQILHLHGELKKVRSCEDEHCILDWEDDLSLNDRAPDGAPLRPHIVCCLVWRRCSCFSRGFKYYSPGRHCDCRRNFPTSLPCSLPA